MRNTQPNLKNLFKGYTFLILFAHPPFSRLSVSADNETRMALNERLGDVRLRPVLKKGEVTGL